MRFKHRERHKKLLLLFTCFVTSCSAISNSCGETLFNVDRGEISSSYSFLESFSCVWLITPPPGKKLLVDIERIDIGAEDIIVVVDDVQLDLPQNCERCKSNLVAETLNVTYRNVRADQNFSDFIEANGAQNLSIGSNPKPSFFMITYRSFDPNSCDPPTSPADGYVIVKNRTVGSRIKFGCNEPYSMSGNAKSTCILFQESPAPIWSPAPTPKCAIPECNGIIQNRTADRASGLIVHPGYPAKFVLSGQHCVWYVQAQSPERRIRINLKFFSLPSKKKKKGISSSYMNVFDSGEDNLRVTLENQESPRAWTSLSNLVILELRTANISLKGNDAGGPLGFMIEYSATCNVIDPPIHGSVSGDVAVGSNLTFECDSGYELVGSEVVTCLRNLNWSNSVPVCSSVDDESVVTAGESEDEQSLKGGNKKTESSVQSANSKEKIKDEDKKPKNNKSGDTAGLHYLPPPLEKDVDKNESSKDTEDLSTVIVMAGVAVPLILISFLGLGCYYWYRRAYPVRMGFGRKFETFENPAYENRKKKSTAFDDHAELQKLTSLPSP